MGEPFGIRVRGRGERFFRALPWVLTAFCFWGAYRAGKYLYRTVREV